MAAGQLNNVLRHLRCVLQRKEGAGSPDADLLKHYVGEGDEAAFAALVRKHGPMVLGVCRRVLRDPHDAEDAFQATFLVLVSKASVIRSPATLGNWLYGVAYRTALHARRAATKRRAKEAAMPTRTETPEASWAELLPVLDQELEQLPEKYRGVIVLCQLQGKSRREAALLLGCPVGTVASRLARGLALLAKRLIRHGLSIPASALAVLLSQETASADVPASVVSGTVKAASLFTGGTAAATGTISVKVAALTEGVLKAMLFTKLKATLAVVLILAFAATATTVLTYGTAAGQQDQPPLAEKPVERAAKQKQPAPATDLDRLQGSWQVFSRRRTTSIRGRLPTGPSPSPPSQETRERPNPRPFAVFGSMKRPSRSGSTSSRAMPTTCATWTRGTRISKTPTNALRASMTFRAIRWSCASTNQKKAGRVP